MEDVPILKVEFLLTRRCQLKCDYCLITDEESLVGPEMDTATVCRMLDLVASLWPGAPVVIFGGEPTTRDDLPQILRHSTGLGIKTIVISNSIRVLKDEAYRKELVDAGLENWSCSLDDVVREGTVDQSCFIKSTRGLEALKLFRDEHGIRDLVTCITVTRHNIERLPFIADELTREGVWSIFTPLQMGGLGYEYSKGNEDDLPTQHQLEVMAPMMRALAESGRYLMHNSPDWFDTWPGQFRKQAWMCNDKALLTVDADGMLRYCVDIPFRPDDRMHVLELADSWSRRTYAEVIAKGPPCKGCLWDPAYEAIKRARDATIGVDEGRRMYRHEVPLERLSQLLPAARHWFGGNPTLRPVGRR